MNAWERDELRQKATAETAEVAQLRADVRVLREVLGTLIAWTAQSAGGPISTRDAQYLSEKLQQVQG